MFHYQVQIMSACTTTPSSLLCEGLHLKNSLVVRWRTSLLTMPHRTLVLALSNAHQLMVPKTTPCFIPSVSSQRSLPYQLCSATLACSALTHLLSKTWYVKKLDRGWWGKRYWRTMHGRSSRHWQLWEDVRMVLWKFRWRDRELSINILMTVGQMNQLLSC